jgi:hypothetical protein
LAIGSTPSATLLQSGPDDLPDDQGARARRAPSLLSSTKIASLGEVIGTIDQDRATAIAGSLGRGPSLLPIHIALETDRGPRREFTFNVVRDQLFTPLLTYLGVVDTLKSRARVRRVELHGEGQGAGRAARRDRLEDMFTGDSPSVGAAAHVPVPSPSC